MCNRCWLLAIVVISQLCAQSLAAAANLSASAQAKVRATTFEVVVAKPTQDSLTYERALPMELLPFNVRNDKYFSIGTAFAIGKNQYVTAAHVLRIGQRSQLGAPALRDSNGNVYSIESVQKFSLAEDFVVFSLTQTPSNNVLKTALGTKIDSPVFAVGNALGEGIVIRDGVYTSDTPESRDGRWKWVRFSAAASPGNSGGPLLNEKGDVIAVITMKSPNENLNYALPIARVLDAKNNVATIDQRSTYHLDIFDATETQTLQYEVPLPLPLDRLAAIVGEKQAAFSKQILDALLKKEQANTFPNGDGSKQLLYAPRNVNFPALIVRGSNGRWEPRVPEKIANVQLSGDARAYFGAHQQSLLMRMQRPSDIAPEKFYGDSKIFGDLFLKAAPFTRPIGPEKIRITSMGAASVDSEHVDNYQRRWRLRIWNLEYQDASLVALLLPCPEGYFAIMRPVPASAINDVVNDFKVLTDFVYLPYIGTMQQWQDFLNEKQLLPAVFSRLQLNIDYAHGFSYRSPRFAYTHSDALFKITKDSTLGLGFAYCKEGEQVVWDVYTLTAYETKTSKTSVNITRAIKPADDLADEVKDGWRRIMNRTHPFDGAPFSEGDRTIARQVIGTSSDPDAVVRYTAGYAAEGKPSDTAMKEKLNLVVKGAQVLEK